MIPFYFRVFFPSNVPDKIDPDIPRPLPRLGTNNISSDPPKHVPSYDVRMTSSASSMTSSKNDEADSDANSLANEKFVVGRKNISLTSGDVMFGHVISVLLFTKKFN